MDQQMGKQELWKGVVLLSAVALFTKILSAGYRIPFQNIAGDHGFYVYQQIYPFYGLVMMLAMYGFPISISKYIAEENVKEQESDKKLHFALAFYGLLFFSLLSTGLLYLGAPLLAYWIGDPMLTAPLRAVSLAFLLLPVLSSLRGYHQGHERMTPTAISHLFEQLVRVCCILLFTFIYIRAGAGAYGAGLGAVYGSLLGGVASIAILFWFSRHVKDWKEWFLPKRLSVADLIKKSSKIMKQSLFVCLSALIFILFQFIDVFSLIRLLGWYGLEPQEAYVAKGVYDRGQPLLQLGTVLTTTFALTLVPLLTKAVVKKDMALANRYHDLALRLTLLIGGAATIGLMVIIEPTNSMLFTDRTGSDVLRIMAIAIVGSTVYMTLSAILQGYGYIHLPAVTVGFGFIVKVVGNLLFIPQYGTKGAAIATVLAFICMVVVQLWMLKKISGKILIKTQPYFAIGLTLMIMLMTTTLWRMMAETVINEDRIADTILALTTVFIGGITVLVCLLRFQLFSESEWATIPKLKRLRQLILKK